MAGKRHHVAYRVSAFIEIGHAAPACCMKANQFVFGNRYDGSFSPTELFTADRLVNATPRGKSLDGSVRLHLVYNGKSHLLIIGNEWRYFLQNRNFHQFFCLFLVKRYHSLPYGCLVQLLNIADP